jgi:hypothetical protein
MGDQPLPTGWRSDEHGNVYRLLTPAERAKIERARNGGSGTTPEDGSRSLPPSATDATEELERAS